MATQERKVAKTLVDSWAGASDLKTEGETKAQGSETSSGLFSQQQNQEQEQTWSMVVSSVPDKFWNQRSVPGGLQLPLNRPDNLTSQTLTLTLPDSRELLMEPQQNQSLQLGLTLVLPPSFHSVCLSSLISL